LYHASVGILVILVTPGHGIVLSQVLDLIVLCVLSDEVLKSLGYLVLQTVCLAVCYLVEGRRVRGREG
jgi:arginine exporter protein ArgO